MCADDFNFETHEAEKGEEEGPAVAVDGLDEEAGGAKGARRVETKFEVKVVAAAKEAEAGPRDEETSKRPGYPQR